MSIPDSIPKPSPQLPAAPGTGRCRSGCGTIRGDEQLSQYRTRPVRRGPEWPALLAELEVDRPLTAVTDLSALFGIVQGAFPDRVLDLAVTESGRLRIRAELRGRRMAAELGSPVRVRG